MLEQKIERYRTEDERLRKVFAKILGAMTTVHSPYGNSKEETVRDLSWEEIASLVGGLKSNEAYSRMLRNGAEARREVESLQREIAFIKTNNKQK